MCQKMGLIQAPSAPLLSPVDLRCEHRASCDAQGKQNKQTRIRKKDRKKEIEREREGRGEIEREREPERGKERFHGKKDRARHRAIGAWFGQQWPNDVHQRRAAADPLLNNEIT